MAGRRNEGARLQGQFATHGPKQRHDLRDQISEEKRPDEHNHDAYHGGVDEQLLGLGSEFILPAQRTGEPLQDFVQPSRLFACPHQADEYGIECAGKLAHRLGQRASAFDVLRQRREHGAHGRRVVRHGEFAQTLE